MLFSLFKSQKTLNKMKRIFLTLSRESYQEGFEEALKYSNEVSEKDFDYRIAFSEECWEASEIKSEIVDEFKQRVKKVNAKSSKN